ncbi:MAG: hypothetical protein D6736_13705 [Nitrospinota bacterium]|nr:MAG: hypothetical protein D6736_13705 [Nitrospinota bacterium]
MEDYATVLVRSESGIIGTLEFGNLFPRDGTDGEIKVSGREAMLVLKDGMIRCITASGEETRSGQPPENLSYLVLRDTLERWQRGEPPPVSVHDCYRAVRLIDQAYELAGRPYG